MPTTAHQLNAELATLVERVERSLVQVRNGRRGVGAGTVWHPAGLIVTSAHVASDGPLRVAFPNGGSLPARILAHDPDRDLAALVVDATGLPTIEVGRSRDLRPGQLVLALGHPWGVPGAITTGVVVGVGSDLPGMPHSRQPWVVVNVRLRPGHSGGPLIDAQGRMVAINTLLTGPAMGMAVPVDVVKAFLREAMGVRRVAA
ncbi:MAG: trypsin-like peptidase domain-containing protein [Chloroflexi bacterium]|nr:trypsin-like peptidase domain-containing protein [Chloroflexota bacterium]